LDLQFLRDNVTDRTTVVVVNFPHNPTGFLPSPDFVYELSRLSDERGFVLLSDEVYRGLEYDPADRLPSLADINNRAVAIAVMSKTYGLAGLRIGWTATQNRSLYEKLAEFKDYTSICNSAPSEYLASLALRNADAIVQRNLQIIGDNLDRLDEFFGQFGGVLDWYRPKAGSIAFPRYLGDSVEGFCEELAGRAGVLLLPGTVFGEDYNSVRIGFGRRNLPDALREFGRYLASLRC
jgi:aspartate/methionine/tyrosine aminotransferase